MLSVTNWREKVPHITDLFFGSSYVIGGILTEMYYNLQSLGKQLNKKKILLNKTKVMT